jgi:mono/diheme cytochrome c family protein
MTGGVGLGLILAAAALAAVAAHLGRRRAPVAPGILAIGGASAAALGLYLVLQSPATPLHLVSSTEPGAPTGGAKGIGASGLPPEDRPTPPPSAAELYRTHCFECHGEEGRGDGPLAARLPVGPANILEHLDHHSEDDLVFLIIRGIPPAMPPMAIEEDDARRIIYYLQGLAL